MVIAELASLIAAFSTERALGRIEKNQGFLKWLAANNHETLRGLLEGNAKAVEGIEALLGQHQDTLLERLDDVDGILAKLLSRIEGFGPVVAAMNSPAGLSEQALSILRQLDGSGQCQFYEAAWHNPPKYILMDGKAYPTTERCIRYTDTRFIDDDLGTLVALGLLRLDHNTDGSRVFILTRAGAALVQE